MSEAENQVLFPWEVTCMGLLISSYHNNVCGYVMVLYIIPVLHIVLLMYTDLSKKKT